MVTIKEDTYKKLIRDALDHYDDKFKLYHDFHGFLDANNLLDKEPNKDNPKENLIVVENKPSEYSENLNDLTVKFLKLITESGVNDPGKTAKYIFDYLYIVYYRAIGRDYNNVSNTKYFHGMSCEEAYKYLVGYMATGLYDLFTYFCLKNNLPLAYVVNQKDDLFARIIIYSDWGENAIRSANDQEFDLIYQSYRKLGELLDYRLYAHIVLDYMNLLNMSKDKLDDEGRKELEKALAWKDDLTRIYESPEKVTFYDFLKEPCAPWAIYFPMADSIMKPIPELNLWQPGYVIDSVIFGSPTLKVKFWLDFKLIRENQSNNPNEAVYTKDIKYFADLLEKEKKARNERRYENMRREQLAVGQKDVKKLVINFLECGMSYGGKPSNPYPKLPSPNRGVKIKYGSLYNKLAKDQEAIELLAITQKEFENYRPSGLIYDDYSKLTYVPLKIMERMLQTELYNNHKADMDIILDPIKKRASKFKDIDAKSLKDRKPKKNEKYPHNPYDMTLGTADMILKTIYRNDPKGPWFFKNTSKSKKSYFYTYLVNGIRNDIAHVGIVGKKNAGVENYRKVAYWFVEILTAFDPFQI